MFQQQENNEKEKEKLKGFWKKLIKKEIYKHKINTNDFKLNKKMREKNTKKQRYSLLKLFPDAKGDVVKRIGTVSRKIRFDKPPIHPIYGLAWYAFVEELFIHN